MTETTRHSFLVRSTHWVNATSVFGLIVSGIAILLAHPRLYWGETGALGTPALINLPLPLLLEGQSGWGRSLHFLSAWASVLTGTVYVSGGLVTHHFGRRLSPFRPARAENQHEAQLEYGSLQRMTYLAVVFVLFPALVWTGLAMSPAITSVLPATVTTLGGHQSARTLHFFAACAATAFLVLHVTMVWRRGFAAHVIPMITGRFEAAKGNR